MNLQKPICIVGTGGFGREALCCLIDIHNHTNTVINSATQFMVDDEYLDEEEIMGIRVIPKSQFNPQTHDALVAIGDPTARFNVISKLPKSTNYATLIHPTAVLSKWVNIEEGSIITAGVVITCNVNIGKHVQINLNTTIGHDCNIGDYFTAAPGVNISGNCTFGSRVHIGTQSSTRENVKICDDVIIGMGSTVIRNINAKGVYVGRPATPLKRTSS